jgi:hypothetical protein
MDDRRQILRRVGIVVLAVGLSDVAFMIYCITQGQSYSSSLNIFAVIAGFFLIRGSERAVRIVRWFSAFYLAAFGSAAVAFPFIFPMELWILNIRLYPGEMLFPMLLLVALVVLLAWVYRQLRAEPVLRESSNAGRSIAPPRLAFALGIVLVVGLTGTALFLLSSDTAKKATLLAKARYGEDYSYFVNSIRLSGKRVQATLYAYNAHEIRPVQVEWQQDPSP